MANSETTDDDIWWERVFAVQEERELIHGCGRECFTFACLCRQEAIAHVTQETGVTYAFE